jgi:lincosamide nucleotidyltransferase
MDEYSDLDFFVIVRPGAKEALLADCGWMEAAFPVMWQFRNTDDGYKLLFSDGIYAEFAIFTAEELRHAAYGPGRFIWRDASLDQSLEEPSSPPPDTTPRPAPWLIGEILSCLYVGINRYLRGERLSAMLFVQQHAFSMLMELMESGSAAQNGVNADPFGRDRRIELRYPETVPLLKKFLRGYEGTLQSAADMLDYLELTRDLPRPIVREIREILESTASAGGRATGK